MRSLVTEGHEMLSQKVDLLTQKVDRLDQKIDRVELGLMARMDAGFAEVVKVVGDLENGVRHFSPQKCLTPECSRMSCTF